MIQLSVLDLIPVREGGTVSDALADAAALAVTAENAGYKRFWVAEHHAMQGVAGGATAVVLGQIGAATKTIRIGAGGTDVRQKTCEVVDLYAFFYDKACRVISASCQVRLVMD